MAGTSAARWATRNGSLSVRNATGAEPQAGRAIRKNLAHKAFQKNIPPPMAEENLRETLKEMMVENLMLRVSKEEIGDDLPLFGPEGLGLDSIDALELVVSLEKKFGVSVPNSETAREALATVNSIHDYVVAHRKIP
jgi:acyl carrier protein